MLLQLLLLMFIFDQEKVVIDCVKEITQYINKVKPKDVEEGELNTIKIGYEFGYF